MAKKISKKSVEDGLVYIGNPKHKDPWQRGRRGSLCPPEISQEDAQKMLSDSYLHGRHRYAVRAGVIYKAQGKDGRWHGYPEAWRRVDCSIRNHFVKSKLVRKSDLSKHWT